MNELKQMQGN